MSEMKGYKLDQWKLLQGRFLDRKRYDHMGSGWKAERDHEEKMTIRLGSLEGLIVARVQSHTLPPQDAEKFVGQLVRAHNALAGRDPEKLEGLLEAVRRNLDILGCCDHFDHHGNCQTHYIEEPCRVDELRNALAAFEGRGDRE